MGKIMTALGLTLAAPFAFYWGASAGSDIAGGIGRDIDNIPVIKQTEDALNFGTDFAAKILPNFWVFDDAQKWVEDANFSAEETFKLPFDFATGVFPGPLLDSIFGPIWELPFEGSVFPTEPGQPAGREWLYDGSKAEIYQVGQIGNILSPPPLVDENGVVHNPDPVKNPWYARFESIADIRESARTEVPQLIRDHARRNLENEYRENRGRLGRSWDWTTSWFSDAQEEDLEARVDEVLDSVGILSPEDIEAREEAAENLYGRTHDAMIVYTTDNGQTYALCGQARVEENGNLTLRLSALNRPTVDDTIQTYRQRITDAETIEDAELADCDVRHHQLKIEKENGIYTVSDGITNSGQGIPNLTNTPTNEGMTGTEVREAIDLFGTGVLDAIGEAYIGKTLPGRFTDAFKAMQPSQ